MTKLGCIARANGLIPGPRFWLREAYEIAFNHSLDPHTQVGAALVWTDSAGNEHSVCGCNRFPSGVKTSPQRWRRPTKYRYVLHAEVAAVLSGLIELSSQRYEHHKNITLYAPWAACNECAKIIIQAGIPRVVAHRQAHLRTRSHWRKSVRQGIEMMQEAGVQYEQWDGKVGGVKNLFDGVWWEP